MSQILKIPFVEVEPGNISELKPVNFEILYRNIFELEGEIVVNEFKWKTVLRMHNRVGHTLRMHRKTMALRGFSLDGMQEKKIYFFN